MSYMQVAVAEAVVRHLRSRSVEAQSEEMVPELTPVHRLRMALPTQVAVVVARITALAAVADQESSLFVIHFLLHRLFRHPRQLLALHALVQH
jgi:hypothetical protein